MINKQQCIIHEIFSDNSGFIATTDVRYNRGLTNGKQFAVDTSRVVSLGRLHTIRGTRVNDSGITYKLPSFEVYCKIIFVQKNVRVWPM